MDKLSKKEFEVKYNLYSQELMNISYGYTKDRDDSFDVIQNVFYKYFNSNKTFLNQNEEKYWLIRVTINECKDLLRQKKKTTVIDEKSIDSFVESDDNNSKDPRLDRLSMLVKELPEKYRVAIILHYYDSLPIKDISKALNASESSIKKRLERARNMLKERMGE